MPGVAGAKFDRGVGRVKSRPVAGLGQARVLLSIMSAARQPVMLPGEMIPVVCAMGVESFYRATATRGCSRTTIIWSIRDAFILSGSPCGAGQNRPAAHQFLASVDLLFEHVVPRACGILVLRHVPPPPCACTLRAHLCSRWAESACAGAIRYRHCSRRKRLRSLRFVLFSLVHGKDHPKANLTRCVGRRAVVASAASGHVDRYAAPPAAALEHLRHPSG